MGPEFQGFGKGLLVIGLILAGCGVALLVSPNVPWLGRLPGDIVIERERFTFSFPLASCLLASVLLTLALWFFGRLR